MNTNKSKLLRIDAVMDRVAYKRSSIYQKIKDDTFPKPRIKRPGFTAWYESDIDLYLFYLESENTDLKWSEFFENRTKNQEKNLQAKSRISKSAIVK